MVKGNTRVPAQIAMVAAKRAVVSKRSTGGIKAVLLDQIVVLVVYCSIGRVDTGRGKT